MATIEWQRNHYMNWVNSSLMNIKTKRPLKWGGVSLLLNKHSEIQGIGHE